MDIIHNIICEFAEEDRNDLYEIIKSKFRSFLQVNLDKIKYKRHLVTELEEIIHKIYSQEGYKYVYNPCINAFYEIHSDSQLLTLIPSDRILWKLRQYIPHTFHKNKIFILKSLKQKIKENHILEWIPPYPIIQKYMEACSRFVVDESCARFFMYCLGAVILKKEEQLIQDDLIYIWTADSLSGLHSWIGTLSRMIYDMFHHSSPFFNSMIKTDITPKMSLDKICYLYFMDSTVDFFVIHHDLSIELLMITCVYVFRNYDLLITPHEKESSPVYFFRSFESRSSIFQDYVESNAIQGNDQLVFYTEIVEDFFEFLRVKSIPISIFTDTELKSIITSCIPATKFMNQTFYRCSLHLSNTYCSHVKMFILHHALSDEMTDYSHFTDYLQKKKWDSMYTIKHYRYMRTWLNNTSLTAGQPSANTNVPMDEKIAEKVY